MGSGSTCLGRQKPQPTNQPTWAWYLGLLTVNPKPVPLFYKQGDEGEDGQGIWEPLYLASGRSVVRLHIDLLYSFLSLNLSMSPDKILGQQKWEKKINYGKPKEKSAFLKKWGVAMRKTKVEHNIVMAVLVHLPQLHWPWEAVGDLWVNYIYHLVCKTQDPFVKTQIVISRSCGFCIPWHFVWTLK